MLARRECYVCRVRIAERQGHWFAWFRIITHAGDCAAVVQRLSKDYSRSTVGRHLSRAEVLRKVEAIAWGSQP
jgi:hypothetical protein